MNDYCRKCKHFRMYIMFYEAESRFTDGYMTGECWKAKSNGWTPENADGEYMSGVMLKEPVGYTEILIGTVKNESGIKKHNHVREIRYGYDEIPEELRDKTQKYMQKRNCILGDDNKDCVFYTERNLEEWNK